MVVVIGTVFISMMVIVRHRHLHHNLIHRWQNRWN